MPALKISLKNLPLFIILASALAPLAASARLSSLDSAETVAEDRNETCYGNICVEARRRAVLPDPQEKPDAMTERQRRDPWSTTDYDSSNSSIRLRIGL